MNTKFLWPLIVFVLLVAVFVVGLTKDPSRIPSPLVDNPAPEFSLPSLQDPDVMVGSADYENQVVLVNIWATWCVGCRLCFCRPGLSRLPNRWISKMSAPHLSFA